MKRLPNIAMIAAVLTILSLGVAVQAQESEVEIREGEVLQVVGNTVLLRIEGEGVKRYTIPSDFRFDHQGNEITVNQLREGMILTGVRLRTTGAADVEDIESAMAEIAEVPAETTAAASEAVEAESAGAVSAEAPASTAEAPATEAAAAESTTAAITEQEEAASSGEGLGISPVLIVGLVLLVLVLIFLAVMGMGSPEGKKTHK